MRRQIAAAEILMAVVAVVVAVLLWRGGVRVDSYGPLLPGSPGFTTTYYSGPWIGGSVAVMALAALLAFDAARRNTPNEN
ncbi:hypothetical protein GCM10007304_07200 [Rhodococcoides trifolii]|uniref:Uncharacterized protein n=1 Tax=Rhodococcoides trifolii TaxID=908250 RepID=A0A917CR86_9NOCA|nr:hypothetical protein [Rhodococcus trifolii]GGF95882.1 hypothetical protein GCM10007304_07200 [Rhodococcus trifolii]